MTKSYTNNELLILLEKHKKHITSTLDWERYRKGKDLPHFQTLIARFGSWNELKKLLCLPLNDQFRPLKYTDEDLQQLLDNHKEHYTSATEWDKYAEVHGLPKHALFYDRLGLDVLSNYLDVRVSWTKKNIENSLLKHFPEQPPTAQKWNELRESEKVPTTMTIIRRYGTWNNMKKEVYQQ